MFNRSTRNSPIGFTIAVLSISIILVMTMMMIEDCAAGSPAICNGTVSECGVFDEEGEEFLMDSEEHRRILATTYANSRGYGGLQPGRPACGNNCAGGRYGSNGRPCRPYDRCR